MRSLWNEADRAVILRRLEELDPTSTPRWGGMNALDMVEHLTRALRMTFGDLSVAPGRSPLRHFPLKQLMLYVLPIPRGVPTAPELIPVRAEGWDEALAALRREIRRFAQVQERPSWPEHPAFGPLSKEAWGILAHRHLDHHLRQFGA